MTKSTITRERLQELAAGQSGFNLRTATHEESQELARMALAAMDSEPVGKPFMYGIADPDGNAYIDEFCVSEDLGLVEDTVNELNYDREEGDELNYSVVALYRHAQPAPVVPPELTEDMEMEYFLRDDWKGTFRSGWEACRAAMLQAGNSPVIGIDLASGPDHSVEVRYVAPPGYVMVPIDLLSELRDWAHPEIEKYCEMWKGRRDSELPALRKVIADADAMVAAAPQPQNAQQNIPEIIPGWIPVSERMPEKGQEVLVYRPKAHEGGDSDVRVAVYGRHNFEHGFGCYWEPSHWMPLPARPQESKP